jgi:hypothetical protein
LVLPVLAAPASNRDNSRKKLGDRHLGRQITEIPPRNRREMAGNTLGDRSGWLGGICLGFSRNGPVVKRAKIDANPATGQTENELNKRIRSEGKTNTQQKSLPDVSTIGSIQFGIR